MSRLAKYLLAATIAFGIACLSGCGPGFFRGEMACDEVSSSRWKSDRQERTYEFADAIVRCGVLDGKSRAEVKDWMGGQDYYPEGTRSMGWDLEAEFDEDSLESEYPMISVELDRKDRVKSAYVNKPY